MYLEASFYRINHLSCRIFYAHRLAITYVWRSIQRAKAPVTRSRYGYVVSAIFNARGVTLIAHTVHVCARSFLILASFVLIFGQGARYKKALLGRIFAPRITSFHNTNDNISTTDCTANKRTFSSSMNTTTKGEHKDIVHKCLFVFR